MGLDANLTEDRLSDPACPLPQLLARTFDDWAVPAIADATSLQYARHARVGNTLAIDAGDDRPLLLRFVAALSDSVLQGDVIIAENRFTRLFAAQQGYQFFLIEDAAVRTPSEATALAGRGRGCAAVAVAPAWLNRGGTVRASGLLLLLGVVAVTGQFSAHAAGPHRPQRTASRGAEDGVVVPSFFGKSGFAKSGFGSPKM